MPSQMALSIQRPTKSALINDLSITKLGMQVEKYACSNEKYDYQRVATDPKTELGWLTFAINHTTTFRPDFTSPEAIQCPKGENECKQPAGKCSFRDNHTLAANDKSCATADSKSRQQSNIFFQAPSAVFHQFISRSL